MQSKIKYSIAILFALILWRPAFAQDGQPPNEIQDLNQHPELNLNDDKTLLVEPDAKANKTQVGAKELNTAVPPKIKPESQAKPSASEKAEEDPLSFNFLYFIIQKFKFSDIVDD
jgi:hypothetical protein